MVCGDTVRHNGDAVNTIIDGAYTVLESFETVGEQLEEIKSLILNVGERQLSHAPDKARYYIDDNQ